MIGVRKIDRYSNFLKLKLSRRQQNLRQHDHQNTIHLKNMTLLRSNKGIEKTFDN